MEFKDMVYDLQEFINQYGLNAIADLMIANKVEELAYIMCKRINNPPPELPEPHKPELLIEDYEREYKR